jgi:hypothetical protein
MRTWQIIGSSSSASVAGQADQPFNIAAQPGSDNRVGAYAEIIGNLGPARLSEAMARGHQNLANASQEEVGRRKI